MTDAEKLLDNLVHALNNTFWSSWQDISGFSKEWNDAAEYLAQKENDNE